ncbi:hypothetical protein BV25DRAFT_1193332 [Artomyces pyxidatus]|uniref:Uncharacterized protein n=1 Tax=Artomyces pyxidatus TaxID=48021 RepID=A0ACB8SRB1_9AGAM|nr:hypothetical protein BV25DRAFT_1193332 [Artomyces pyxidatus]
MTARRVAKNSLKQVNSPHLCSSNIPFIDPPGNFHGLDRIRRSLQCWLDPYPPLRPDLWTSRSCSGFLPVTNRSLVAFYRFVFKIRRCTMGQRSHVSSGMRTVVNDRQVTSQYSHIPTSPQSLGAAIRRYFYSRIANLRHASTLPELRPADAGVT